MTCKECRHWEQCVLPDGTTRYYGTENACGNVHSLCKWFISKTDAAQQKWIPVTERLPGVLQRVLVWCESKTVEKHITTCTYMGGQYGCGQWSRHVRRVTHWMPLPQPPKEGE